MYSRNTRTRLREFRKVLGSGEILESFDRVVFESVVEKIIIGGYNDEMSLSILLSSLKSSSFSFRLCRSAISFPILGRRFREVSSLRIPSKILESFDRVVFESVVEKIVIGGYNDEGVEEPLKITFVYKTGIHSNFNGKDIIFHICIPPFFWLVFGQKKESQPFLIDSRSVLTPSYNDTFWWKKKIFVIKRKENK